MATVAVTVETVELGDLKDGMMNASVMGHKGRAWFTEGVDGVDAGKPHRLALHIEMDKATADKMGLPRYTSGGKGNLGSVKLQCGCEALQVGGRGQLQGSKSTLNHCKAHGGSVTTNVDADSEPQDGSDAPSIPVDVFQGMSKQRQAKVIERGYTIIA